MIEYEEFQKLQNAMMRMQEEYETKLLEKKYQLDQEEKLRIKCQKKIRYLRAKIKTIVSEKELLTQKLTEKEESEKEEQLRIKCQKKIRYLRAKIKTIDSEKELLKQKLTEKEESEKTNLQKEKDYFATKVIELEQLRIENEIVNKNLQAKNDETEELKSKVLNLIAANQAYDEDLKVNEEKIACLTKKLADMATNLKEEKLRIKCQKKIRYLRAKIKTIDSEKELLKQKLTEKEESEKTNLQKEKDHFATKVIELEQLRIENEIVNKNLQAKNDETEELKSKVLNLIAANQAYDEDLKVNEEKIACLTKKLADMATNLKEEKLRIKCQKKIRYLRAKIKTIDSEKELLKQKLTEKEESEKTNLQKEKDHFATKVIELEQLRIENEIVNKNLQAKNDETDELKSKVLNLIAANQAYDEDLKVNEEKIACLTKKLADMATNLKEEQLRIKCQKKIRYLRAKIKTIDSEKELLKQKLTEKEESEKTNLQKEKDHFATKVIELEQLRIENEIVNKNLQAKNDETDELKSKVLNLIAANQAYDEDLKVNEEKIACLTKKLADMATNLKEEQLRIKCQKKIRYLRAKIKTIDSEKELLKQKLTEKEESEKTNLQKEKDYFATKEIELEQLRIENEIVNKNLQAKNDETEELKSKVLNLIAANQAYDEDLKVNEEKIACLTKKLADMATNLKSEIEQRKKSLLKKEKEIKSLKMVAAKSKGSSLEVKENRRNSRKNTSGDELQRYEDLIYKKKKLESALNKVPPCFENWKRRNQLEDYLQEVEEELGDLRKLLKQHGF